MRSLGWLLIQNGMYPFMKRRKGYRHNTLKGRPWQRGEYDQLQDRGPNPGDTLTWGFQTPELLENQYPVCRTFLCQPSKPVEGSDDCREDGRKKRKWESLWTLWKWNLLTASLSALLCRQILKDYLFNERADGSGLRPGHHEQHGDGRRWECSRFLAVFSPDTHLLQWFINTWPPDYSSNFVLWCFLHVSCEITVQ